MKKTKSDNVCPVAEMLELVGERHMLTIIYNLIAGPRGFNELQDQLEINTATLSKRLDRLEEEQLVERTMCDTDSRRCYYSLTKRGKRLSKLIEQFSEI